MSQGTELIAARRRAVRRRAKRGVVAGYIHELSARHRAAGATAPERGDAAAPEAPSGILGNRAIGAPDAPRLVHAQVGVALAD